ncbi:hypothetical protein A3D62_00620 [Candidatus Kaiserbacteria bacterium RIFCSPHIGHO2_02_FULL_49_11]|uniref:Uncharacterized protein n=1 Tax=Candidatus Kaiserbacteria bacterium RIFCSPHIGHO2_02_FULL_49_11 TaxID=1798489 RepID=A0A1F6CZM6_9BACT|nr:MAG: hypothetical protein A3D62_00620 [Candidatus Kaiserbacteria bacterium RIFCSPHIGHO2_02_FULL_49_11]
MLTTSRAIKIATAWISVVYVICYAGVALFLGIREGFMEYALHTRIDTGVNVVSLTTFITGLIVWNVMAAVAAWLFVVLTKYFSK